MIIDSQATTVSDPYAVTVRISIALNYQQDGTPPAAKLVPQSYTSDGHGAVLIRFRNDGTAAGGMPMAEYGTYVVLDDGGLPLTWGQFNESEDDAFTYKVEPGAFGGGLSGQIDVCGAAIRAYVKFESLSAPHP